MVRIAAASEPASASVSANAMRCSPDASPGNQRACCSCVPASRSGSDAQLLDGEDQAGRGAGAAQLLDREADATAGRRRARRARPGTAARGCPGPRGAAGGPRGTRRSGRSRRRAARLARRRARGRRRGGARCSSVRRYVGDLGSARMLRSRRPIVAPGVAPGAEHAPVAHHCPCWRAFRSGLRYRRRNRGNGEPAPASLRSVTWTRPPGCLLIIVAAAFGIVGTIGILRQAAPGRWRPSARENPYRRRHRGHEALPDVRDGQPRRPTRPARAAGSHSPAERAAIPEPA